MDLSEIRSAIATLGRNGLEIEGFACTHETEAKMLDLAIFADSSGMTVGFGQMNSLCDIKVTVHLCDIKVTVHD